MGSLILRCAFHEFPIYMYLNQHTEQQLNKNFREAEDRQKRHRLINTAHTFSVQKRNKRCKVKSVHDTLLTGSHGCWTLSSFRSLKRVKVLQIFLLGSQFIEGYLPPLPPTQHFIKCPWQFAGTHLYSWMEIGTASVASFLKAIVVQYQKSDVISS